MEIPSWALTIAGIVFTGLLGLAVWGFRYLVGRVTSDIEKLGDKLDRHQSSIDTKIDRVEDCISDINVRLVRVETVIGSKPGATPAFGVPIPDNSG